MQVNVYYYYFYNNIKENSYEVLPYNIENDNINFFMVLNKEKEKLTFNYYTLNLNENIKDIPIVKEFDNMDIRSKRIRYIIINNLAIIKCFYYSKNNNNNKHLLASTNFSINENIDIIKDNTFNLEVMKEIKQIKSSISYNYNFFVCISLNCTPACFINKYLENVFNEIDCKFTSDYSPNYKVLYFNETDDFMLISRYDLTATLISNFNFSVIECKKYNFLRPQTNSHSIIY